MSRQRRHPALDFLAFVEGESPSLSTLQLLDRILQQSRTLSRAEAGTIFILHKRGAKAWLEPMHIQNDAIRVKRGTFRVPVGPGTIAGYVAHSGRTVMIGDVYRIARNRPYSFNAANELPGYRTRSMFCFPLVNYGGAVIGVVQLINARRPGVKKPVPFDADIRELVAAASPAICRLIERNNMLDSIRDKNRSLRQKNKELRTQREHIAALQNQTEQAFQLSVSLLSRAAEIHDEETGNHVFRVGEYSYYFGQLVGKDKEWCEILRYSAQLHDVGKMSIDASVLKKKGRLTAEERSEMDQHTTYGHQILTGTPRLEMAAEVALNHHEKWDGSGYPNGVKGEHIPLPARIVAIADIYDALRSERPYKPAFSHAKAVRILTKGDERIDPASHFDPRLLGLFSEHHAQFDRIWRNLMD